MKLIWLLALATGFWINPSLQNSGSIEQVRYEYVIPTNSAQEQLYERLKAMHVLERLSEFLSPLRLPRPLTLKLQTCGKVNAYYWNDVVTACYEYFDYLLKVAPDMPTPEGLTRHDALAGMTADLFLHETGHAVLDMLEIPFTGREEDVADEFSAYVLLQMAKDDARRLILGVAYLGSEQAQREMTHPPPTSEFADIHELPVQRYYNVLCMAYGEDPNTFGDAIQYWHLPEARAKRCSYEYRRFQYAFNAMISPSLDWELVPKIRAKRLLNYQPASATE
jgi:hypothetical protein